MDLSGLPGSVSGALLRCVLSLQAVVWVRRACCGAACRERLLTLLCLCHSVKRMQALQPAPLHVRALTVLLPELPPAAVLGAPGGPLLLPPAGHVFDMIGVRLKPSGGPAGMQRGTAGGMDFQVFELGAALAMGARFNLTELVQRARLVIVEGHTAEAVCSCAMDELGGLLAASPLQELQISCTQVSTQYEGRQGSSGSGGGGVMGGAAFLQMAVTSRWAAGVKWGVLAAGNGRFHIRRR
ncbi:hypothetical protein ABPG75_011484 [Micractinium tetrahymenae]